MFIHVQLQLLATRTQIKLHIAYLPNRHNSIFGSKLRTDKEQLRLEILKKLRTASFNSQFISFFKKKKCNSIL